MSQAHSLLLNNNQCTSNFYRKLNIIMSRLTTIEIAKQYLHFSAAHFTIFNATERERLHGHNFRIAVAITGEVDNLSLIHI